jgi:hypothetical protein
MKEENHGKLFFAHRLPGIDGPLYAFCGRRSAARTKNFEFPAMVKEFEDLDHPESKKGVATRCARF